MVDSNGALTDNLREDRLRAVNELRRPMTVRHISWTNYGACWRCITFDRKAAGYRWMETATHREEIKILSCDIHTWNTMHKNARAFTYTSRMQTL